MLFTHLNVDSMDLPSHVVHLLECRFYGFAFTCSLIGMWIIWIYYVLSHFAMSITGVSYAEIVAVCNSGNLTLANWLIFLALSEYVYQLLYFR